MKQAIVLLLLCLACQQAPPARQAVNVREDTTFLTGTFFLVRHAERHPGRDSTLTPEGLRRAGALYALLKDSGIQKIYITPYKRSAQTADSLRIYGALDTVLYRPDTTGEGLIYQVTRHNDWGRRLLVVGHSNTLVPLMRALKARPPVDSVGDKEFDRLFIVRKQRDQVRVQAIRFGAQQ